MSPFNFLWIFLKLNSYIGILESLCPINLIFSFNLISDETIVKLNAYVLVTDTLLLVNVVVPPYVAVVLAFLTL